MSTNNTVDCGFVYKAPERKAEPLVDRDCGFAPPVTAKTEPEAPPPVKESPKPAKAARK
jgi:hypothetical protein